MKHNIIFALLTAVILVSGFFTMDIVQYFNKSTSEESFKSISKGESNAVYLSSEREIINPMSLITPSEQEISPIYCDVATNIVRAMSRYNKTTYIAWGTDIHDLNDAWQYGGDNLIYVDKWKYINYGKKSERLLDCIINTVDFNILYIRFYSEEKHELSANEINRGLDVISSESAEFYPNVNGIAQAIEDTLNYLQDVREQESDGMYNNEYINFNDIGLQRTEYSNYNYYNNNCYISSYNNMKEFVNYFLYDSELYKFWLSPLDISYITIIYNDGMYENEIIAYPVHYLIDGFMQLSLWFHPSYSSKDGRIYQSMILNTGKLVVIYSVKEDMIEGFYFESY